MARTEMYPSEMLDRFLIRLPDGMRDRIKLAADANNRSMNSEIVATLEEKYPPLAIDDSAARDLLTYLLEAQTEADFNDRRREVDAKLRAMGSPARVVHPLPEPGRVGIAKTARKA